MPQFNPVKTIVSDLLYKLLRPLSFVGLFKMAANVKSFNIHVVEKYLVIFKKFD